MASSPSLDSPKLCQDIFSILESQFLFGTSPVRKPSPLANSPAGKVRILSIDDGDSDLVAVSLLCLEDSLRLLSGTPSATISHFFDLAVGSGSGALLASLLFANNLSASDAFLLLSKIRSEKTKSRSRFGRLFKKESKIFDKVFGEVTLKDASKPLLITCYDLNTGAPFVFSRVDAVEADGFDFKVRDVCEAATCQGRGNKEVRSVDGETRVQVVDAGSVVNPTAVGITHVLHNKQEFPFVNGLEDVFVLSIGGSGARVNDVASIAGACQADVVDQAVAMAFADSRKSNYVRIQGNGMSAGSTAEEVLSEASVESVLFEGKKSMKESNRDRLEWAAGELFKEQQSKRRSVFMKPVATPRTSSSSSSAMTSTTMLTRSSESP